MMAIYCVLAWGPAPMVFTSFHYASNMPNSKQTLHRDKSAVAFHALMIMDECLFRPLACVKPV